METNAPQVDEISYFGEIMILRRLTLSLLLLTSTSFAQNAALPSSGFDRTYKLTLTNPVQDKNFYLLSLWERNPAVRRLLRENKILRKLSGDKFQAMKMAANCNDVACFDRLFRFSDPAIETVAAQLKALSKRPEFKKLIRKDMRPSGAFIKYDQQSDSEMFVAAWRDAANGMNRLLRIYGLGKDPLYRNIDRVSFDVSSEEYQKLLKAKLAEIKLSRNSLFFEPTLNFALKLLEANRRDEAARYEPLEEGQNKPVIQEMPNIKWSDYPYSFILVLGSGPQDSARMSRTGARRADQGAQLYLEHKAPILIVSGGHVHPMQTPFNESIEMKKYLMEKFKIPEKNILIDPYARHTTTNFRNAGRLAIRYGIPSDRKALVTSSEDHITLTTKDGFRIRCMTELGYFPMEFITRISPTAAEWKPSVASLFLDSNDPLDP
jgi:hypothetical protein